MKKRHVSIDLATRVVLIPTLCLIALVAFAATSASRASRQSLTEGATHAASVLCDGVVLRLMRTGKLPEPPEGVDLRLVSHEADALFASPAGFAEGEALRMAGDGSATEYSWLDTSGDGLLRLRHARRVALGSAEDGSVRQGVVLVSMRLDGADDVLFERAIARTAWLIFGGVIAFAAMISCVRWIGIAPGLRQAEASTVGRELAAAVREAEDAEQSAITRLVREAEELASVATPPSPSSEDVEGDLERLRHVADGLKEASDRLGALAVNCAVGAARSQLFDAELFDAADAIRRLSDSNREAAEQIMGVCDANEDDTHESEAFARVGYLVKVAHEAAETQQARRELMERIAAQLSGESAGG